MLYRTMKRIIERGNYDAADVRNKLDIFFAADRLTEAEYTELYGMISANNGGI